MRLAAVVFVAALAFALAAARGELRLGSSTPAPPAVVLGGATGSAVPKPPRSASKIAVGRRVDHSWLNAYRAERFGSGRP